MCCGELQCLARWLLSKTGIHGVLLGPISPGLHGPRAFSSHLSRGKHHKPRGGHTAMLKDQRNSKTAAMPHHRQSQLGPPGQQEMHAGHQEQTTKRTHWDSPQIWVYYLLSEITWSAEKLKCLLGILRGAHTTRRTGEPVPPPLITKPRRFNCVLQQLFPRRWGGSSPTHALPFPDAMIFPLQGTLLITVYDIACKTTHKQCWPLTTP